MVIKMDNIINLLGYFLLIVVAVVVVLIVFASVLQLISDLTDKHDQKVKSLERRTIGDEIHRAHYWLSHESDAYLSIKCLAKSLQQDHIVDGDRLRTDFEEAKQKNSQ